MTVPVVSAELLSLSLTGNAGKIDILHDITLDVLPGETLALVGPSGSGKSSLLMLMGGLERASSGRINALGHDLSAMSKINLPAFDVSTWVLCSNPST